MVVKELLTNGSLRPDDQRCYASRFLVDVHVRVVSNCQVEATVYKAGSPSEPITFTGNDINSKELARLLGGKRLYYTPGNH